MNFAFFSAISLAQKTALAGAALSALSLCIAYFFMERFLLLEPCPLCILDRIAVGVFGAACTALFFCEQKQKRIAAWTAWGIATASLAAGFVFAVRHIWLQNQPPDESAFCLPEAADGMLQIIARAFDANADCGAISWQFAGLTIPEQVLLLFVVLALLQITAAVAMYAKQKAAQKK